MNKKELPLREIIASTFWRFDTKKEDVEITRIDSKNRRIHFTNQKKPGEDKRSSVAFEEIFVS